MKRKTFLLVIFFFLMMMIQYASAKIVLHIESNNTVAKATIQKLSERIKKRITILNQLFFPQNEKVIHIQVHFIKTRAEWEQLFRQYSFVEWSSGVAFTRSNKIFILLQQESLGEITETFAHEVIHILNHTKWGAFDIPVWFDEGLAQYFSGKQLPLSDQVFLSNFILLNQLLPFKKIDSLYNLAEKKAHLGYIESYLAIKHFDDVLGAGSLKKLMLKNPVGFKDFSHYFYSIFGISVDGFESKFLVLIKEKYKYLFILNLENALFLAIVAFLFVAYWMIRRKNRIRLEQMEDSEFEEGGLY